MLSFILYVYTNVCLKWWSNFMSYNLLHCKIHCLLPRLGRSPCYVCNWTCNCKVTRTNHFPCLKPPRTIEPVSLPSHSHNANWSITKKEHNQRSTYSTKMKEIKQMNYHTKWFLVWSCLERKKQSSDCCWRLAGDLGHGEPRSRSTRECPFQASHGHQERSWPGPRIYGEFERRMILKLKHIPNS